MIPQPSTIIKCTDLVSCFQTLYNFFFMLLLALAFLIFVYGAFQYLLSGGGIFKKEEGKKKMINSIVAIIVVLLIPPILQFINPQIFKGIEMEIPKITAKLPEYEGEAEEPPPSVEQIPVPIKDKLVRVQDLGLSNIHVKYPEIRVNQGIVQSLIKLDEELRKANLKIIITAGYSLPKEKHASNCHNLYGTCIDFVIEGVPNDINDYRNYVAYHLMGTILIHNLGLNPLFETVFQNESRPDKGCKTKKINRGSGPIEWKFCKYTSGTHIHVELPVSPIFQYRGIQ